MSNFSEILRELMSEQNLKVCELAERAGLSQSMVYSYKKGATLPNAKSLVKLARYFNCSVDYLLGKTFKKQPYTQSNSTESFITRLDRLLDENKITVYRLAKSNEFAKANYYDWKKKGTSPAFEQLVKLADYFCVSCDYLLGLTDKK